MGWRDAPVVQETKKAKWANAPVVEQPTNIRGSIPIADGVVNAVPETLIVKPRDYSFGDVTAEATAPSRQMMAEGISSLYAPKAAPGTLARAGEGITALGKTFLGGLGTLSSGAVGLGVEMLPESVVTQGGVFDPVTGRRKLAQDINNMLMFAEPNPVTTPRAMARGATKTTPQRVVKPALEERPSEVIKKEAQELFRAPEIKGLKFKPAAGDKLIDDVTTVIENDALFSPVQHTKVIRSMRDIEKTIGQPLTYERLQGLSSRLGAAAEETKDATQATILRNMKRSVDEFMGSAPDTLLETGNLPKAKETLLAAKETWKRKLKSETVEDILNDIRLASKDKDISAVVKSKFKTLAGNKDEMARFSDEERALIEDLAAGGSTLQQILGGTGKLAPGATRGVLTGLYGLLTSVTGIPAVVAAGGATAASRNLANRMATAQLNRFYDSILRGEVLPANMPVTMGERGLNAAASAQKLQPGAVAAESNRNSMAR